ncbi:MAG: DNA polymerase/3'-5' exonuclease PolX [Planctomycetota bacterium]
MSTNERIAKKLDEMAQMLELLGENKFRVNAHAKAARVLRDLSTDVATLVDTPDELTAIDGIGAKTADKIVEFVDSGRIAEHAELASKVPAGLFELLTVPGLGPKTIRAMWQDKGVESRADLQRIIDDGTIADLPRMGEKAVDKIRKGLEFAKQSTGRIPIGVARPVAVAITERMRAVKGVQRADFAGSLRRGKETIGDVDVLVVADDPEAAHDAFRTMPEVDEVIAAGETKSSVRLRVPTDPNQWKSLKPEAGATLVMQADLRTVPAESWGAALMYFTGSKEHNVRLRERAQQRGLTLNEYGLFPDDPDAEGTPQSRGVKAKASKEEKDVFAALKLAEVPPEMREDRGEVAAADRSDGPSQLPKPMSVSDIKAELHAHTTASDGRLELIELAKHARDRGFHTIAVTDHSKASAIANGLDEDRLRAQAETVAEVNAELDDIDVLRGSEVDIMADGTLDFDDDVLGELDVVVASPHVALTQDGKDATKRLLKVIENPFVHIVGHPTGRLVGRREGLSPAMDEIIAAAVEHNVALEINAHWLRLDLRDTHVRAVTEAGGLIAIDCDVHHPHDFDNLIFGVLTGRRGWLTKERCVNCWSKTKLRKWLSERSG